MTQLMRAHQFEYVIDTTTLMQGLPVKNIQAACVQSGCKYIRLLREPVLESKR